MNTTDHLDYADEAESAERAEAWRAACLCRRRRTMPTPDRCGCRARIDRQANDGAGQSSR
ncbi:MAG: hypothetical protein JNM43_04835 [Planctomycetaceae bacterium]|nr:hypothetical protein [Planctomycetaceae bacterium]